MKLSALALVLLVACGDNIDPPRFDGGGGDVDAETAVMPRGMIVAGDFQATGVMSSIDLASRSSANNIAPEAAVGADPILRKIGDELFVINRIENNVTILDANDAGLVVQLGTGDSSNPQDVAVDGDKVFVATYARKGLIEITRGSGAIVDIDLSADDPDLKPNCASIYKVGTKLFVTCQLLDDTNFFANRGLPGKVYVVDIATRAVQFELDLSTSNPFSLLEQIPDGSMHAGDLLVGTVDFRFGNNNAGCIERITTGATPTAAGCMINNTALSGGFASRLEVSLPTTTSPSAHVIPAPTLFFLVPRADFSGGDVRTVDLVGETLAADAYNTAGQALGDVAACPDGTIVVAENPPFGAPANAAQGVRIYNSAKNEATTLAIRIGLKPTSSRGLVCY